MVTYFESLNKNPGLQKFVKKNISRSIWYVQGTIVDGRQADFRDCIHRVSKASAGDWKCSYA